MATHFSGPVVSDGGFIGPQVQEPTAYTADGAIDPTDGVAVISKGSAAAMTLAAPGAAMVGRNLMIIVTTTFAHVVVVTGLDGGTTLTFSTAGESVTLYARSATAWSLVSNNGAVQSA
jgi:fructose-1,6-bisphosphatase/sedoheptulose 1,7-bisphosphatase-like protein